MREWLPAEHVDADEMGAMLQRSARHDGIEVLK